MLVMKTLFLACSLAMCQGTTEFGNHKVETALQGFQACDTDNNDLIEVAEFLAFFKAGGLNKVKWTREIEDSEYLANFNLMDVTSDKHLDQREWTIAFTLYGEFKHYDTNKDFLLSADELVNLFNAKDGPAGHDIAYVEYLARIINDLKLVY